MCVQPVLIIVNMLYEQITTSENIPPQWEKSFSAEMENDFTELLLSVRIK